MSTEDPTRPLSPAHPGLPIQRAVLRVRVLPRPHLPVCASRAALTRLHLCLQDPCDPTPGTSATLTSCIRRTRPPCGAEASCFRSNYCSCSVHAGFTGSSSAGVLAPDSPTRIPCRGARDDLDPGALVPAPPAWAMGPPHSPLHCPPPPLYNRAGHSRRRRRREPQHARLPSRLRGRGLETPSGKIGFSQGSSLGVRAPLFAHHLPVLIEVPTY